MSPRDLAVMNGWLAFVSVVAGTLSPVEFFDPGYQAALLGGQAALAG